jgi:hypothetical protein
MFTLVAGLQRGLKPTVRLHFFHARHRRLAPLKSDSSSLTRARHLLSASHQILSVFPFLFSRVVFLWPFLRTGGETVEKHRTTGKTFKLEKSDVLKEKEEVKDEFGTVQVRGSLLSLQEFENNRAAHSPSSSQTCISRVGYYVYTVYIRTHAQFRHSLSQFL